VTRVTMMTPACTSLSRARVRAGEVSSPASPVSPASPPLALADRLEAVLAERGPLPGCTLARELRRRYADVLAALNGDPRFHRSGKRRACRWGLGPTPRSFDVGEAAERWGCRTETAAEILFGSEGFLERGLVASVNGNGTVTVTAAGVALSRAVALGLAP